MSLIGAVGFAQITLPLGARKLCAFMPEMNGIRAKRLVKLQLRLKQKEKILNKPDKCWYKPHINSN